MHHAGGAATAFRQWQKLLPDDVALTATVLPGRGRRFGQEMHADLLRAADEVAEALDATWSDANNVLFGHSLGGLIAFEVCRRLESRGRRPARLVLSGVAPKRSNPQSRHEWSDEALQDLMKEMGGTPEEVFEHEDLLALALPVLRADFRLVDTYQLDGDATVQTPITAIRGAEDRYLHQSAMENWREHTAGEFHRAMFPGGHFYLDDHRRDVVRWLVEHLADVRAIPPR
jgi:surfactin synthase thioesterase subunit